jgi:Mn-dependent DtxR family transcriptional regulator
MMLKTQQPSRKGWKSSPAFDKQGVMPPKHVNSNSAAATRSESTEDHLERIQELVDQKGYARVSDIAVSLGLSRSTVSNMVRRLAQRGFVNYEKYRGFTLTPEGRAVADHVRVRHRTLTEMLQLLGISPETVEQEVEVIEHHLRPETLRVFSRLVRFWQNHPAQIQAFLRDGKSK